MCKEDGGERREGERERGGGDVGRGNLKMTRSRSLWRPDTKK